MISLKIGGIIVAAFIAGAFVASPELRAYAANTVFSSDIVDGEVKTPDIGNSAVINAKIAPNAVTTSKINDGAVRTADIANGNVTNAKLAANSVDSSKIVDNSITHFDIGPDEVGSSELVGVTKLLFSDCSKDLTGVSYAHEVTVLISCPLKGTDLEDDVLATKNLGGGCYAVSHAVVTSANTVQVGLTNGCSFTTTPGNVKVSIIVFHT